MHLAQNLKKNLASLASLQVVTYLVPLATLPWLTRVLGPSGYGELGLVMAVAAYLTLLVDYGFNLSATNKIAVHRNDGAKCSRIFWETLGAKALLGLAALVGLLTLIALVPRFAAIAPLLLIGFLGVLGAILTPVWYFQGLERMAGFAAINALVKLLSVPLIYLFVATPDDLAAAVVIQAGSIALAGLANLTILLAGKSVARPHITFAGIWNAMRDGFGLFLAQAGVSLYTAANLIILGLVSTPRQVGYFAAAMVLMRAMHGLLTPITNAVFPHISNMMAHRRSDALLFLRGLAKSLALMTLTASIALITLAPLVVTTLFGADFAPAASVLQYLAPTLLIIAMSNLLGVQTMIPLGHRRGFTAILLSAGALNLFLMILWSHSWGAQGAALAVVTTEAAVTIAMALYLWRYAPELRRTATPTQATQGETTCQLKQA